MRNHKYDYFALFLPKCRLCEIKMGWHEKCDFEFSKIIINFKILQK